MAPHQPLTSLEIAGGTAYGLDPAVPPLDRTGAAVPPRQAMEAVLRSCLEGGRCFISFSGGRDSTSLLSLAVDVARREGLALPVPVTLDFGDDPEAKEDDWQRLALEHLGLSDWVRLNGSDYDLDAVGAIATSALTRHGLLWPFNAHFHVPMIEVAAGGTLITGFGGDELANSSATAHAEQALYRQRPLRRSDVLSVGLALAPLTVRQAVHRRRAAQDLATYPWLTPAGARALADGWARDWASIPFGWPRVMNHLWQGRYFALCRWAFDQLGAEHNVRVVHPLVERPVLEAFAASGRRAGYGSRAELLTALFGEVMAPEIVARRTKAGFTNPLWTDQARAFAAGLAEGDVTENPWVDGVALRRAWVTPPGDARATLLLQEAWIDRTKGA